ncbi:DUF3817 domain-containing protein [Giesbergeria sp.]|uniref:DUF3817 domain-containing protein n=1 Tax=Giesbergeria sp. TaxID=2818473 RepID=UPI00262011D6|nr:DUF3817 domain-containing protein [Giesbergeria sp.]
MIQPSLSPAASVALQTPLQWLRRVSWLEGVTLLLLLGVAVPLKRLAGWPQGVSVLGPVHGTAFLLYLGMVLWVTAGPQWTFSERLQLLVASLVPFGAWMLGGLFRRKAHEFACAKGDGHSARSTID